MPSSRRLGRLRSSGSAGTRVLRLGRRRCGHRGGRVCRFAARVVGLQVPDRVGRLPRYVPARSVKYVDGVGMGVYSRSTDCLRGGYSGSRAPSAIDEVSGADGDRSTSATPRSSTCGAYLTARAGERPSGSAPRRTPDGPVFKTMPGAPCCFARSRIWLRPTVHRQMVDHRASPMSRQSRFATYLLSETAACRDVASKHGAVLHRDNWSGCGSSTGLWLGVRRATTVSAHSGIPSRAPLAMCADARRRPVKRFTLASWTNR